MESFKKKNENIQTPVLTGAEQHDVKMLMQQIHQHDQTYRDPYFEQSI
ncbi:hypothetical protein PT285_04790 [Lactobacillus sp. ESL0791]|nr:hypothetical protein [Lactobacillus sp. ESL0791]MDF7638714.1 hypothetical protein [Lactobacillus sp. ESL0791]